MKLGLINSAFTQVGIDPITSIEHTARIGFDTIDIFTEATTLAAEEKAAIAAACEKQDLPIASVVVVAIGLIDFNDPVRAYHVDRCKRFIDLAEEWGANNVLLVLGEYIWQREVIPPEEQWRWAIESCRELGDYAGERGVEIALELEPSDHPGVLIREYLVATQAAMFRIKNFCEAAGLTQKFEAGRLTEDDCRGSKVRARIMVEEGGEYPDKNRVEEYLKLGGIPTGEGAVSGSAVPASPAGGGHQGIDEDDIPF